MAMFSMLGRRYDFSNKGSILISLTVELSGKKLHHLKKGTARERAVPINPQSAGYFLSLVLGRKFSITQYSTFPCFLFP